MPLRVHIPGLCAVLLAGCGESPKPAATVADSHTRFVVPVGGTPLRMRVMITDTELAGGLMDTPVLPPDEGMLFVYRDADRRAFWMKNVPYDIDIGFFDTSGVLTQVCRLRADDLTPVESDSDGVRYALEAPVGWYAAHALKPGATIELPAVAGAVRARGFDAKVFVSGK